MTPERWQQIKPILVAARERPRSRRQPWLTEACGGDSELQRDVESFLEHEDRLDGFIEQPVLSFADDATEGVDQLEAGHRVGPYRLVRLLGEGGMGAVYLAERQQEFEQQVALKLLRPGLMRSEVIRRFEAERQILARLDHPNIARLLDGGTTEDGAPYFAMELIEGEPIDRYCDRHRLSTRRRLELFEPVCSALQLAHQNLVIHRDLKPGNILVDASGTPKLLDFGIAKLLEVDSSIDTELTRTRHQAMTVSYASPEQLKGERIGTVSDIYALGVVLYQVLTGRLPCGLGSRNQVELMVAICEEEPVLPSVVVGRNEELVTGHGVRELTPASVSRARDGDPATLRRHLAGDIDSILTKALRKEPRRRYASAEQLAADLRRHLEGLPVLARPDTLSYRVSKFLRRHRLAVAGLAAMLALVLGFTLALVSQLRETERARDRAEGVSKFLIDLFEASAPDRPSDAQPTVKSLLEHGRKELETGLQREPKMRATLLLRLGEVSAKFGAYTEAQQLLEEGVGLLRRQHAGDNPELAQAINNLAAIAYWTGEAPRAEVLYRESIAMRRRLGLEDDLIKPMNNLAAILLARGELEEAREIFRESLARRRASLEAASVDSDLDYRRANVATSLRSLATAHYTAGDLDAAEPLLREALDIRHDIYGSGSVKSAAVLSSLGRLEQARGHLDEAEVFFTEALEIRRQKLGEEHLHTALAGTDVAAVLFDRDPAAGSTVQVLLAQALETLYRIRPEDDSNVAAAESLLGALLAAEGRLEEAEICLSTAYATLERQRGPQAIQTLSVRRRLADFYAATGRARQADKLRLP